jgi:DNA-binding transcriptional MerR regulator
MRISELARQSGVSVPTIKYYLRLGLLETGRITAHNQATYDESHLRRLRLIRVFVDIGGLTVRATREVLASIDAARLSAAHLLGILDAARAEARREALDGDLRSTAIREVTTLMEDHSWRVQPTSQALQRLVDAYVAARLLKMQELCAAIDRYAKAAADVAECEAAVARALAERLGADEERPDKSLMEVLSATVVLGDAMLTTVHSLAREDALTRLFAEWQRTEA